MADGAWQMGMEMAKRQMATSIDKENLQTVCLTLHMMAGSAGLAVGRGERLATKSLWAKSNTNTNSHKLLQNVIKKPATMAGNLIFQSRVHGVIDPGYDWLRCPANQ